MTVVKFTLQFFNIINVQNRSLYAS